MAAPAIGRSKCRVLALEPITPFSCATPLLPCVRPPGSGYASRLANRSLLPNFSGNAAVSRQTRRIKCFSVIARRGVSDLCTCRPLTQRWVQSYREMLVSPQSDRSRCRRPALCARRARPRGRTLRFFAPETNPVPGNQPGALGDPHAATMRGPRARVRATARNRSNGFFVGLAIDSWSYRRRGPFEDFSPPKELAV